MKKQQKTQARKQERALKKRTQRKLQLAHRRDQVADAIKPADHVRMARSYPIEGCWVQQGWEDDGLAMVLLARRQPDGNLVVGAYVVDYYCTGLKQTSVRPDFPSDSFHQEYLPSLFPTEPPLKISPALAHEIIYGSIEYAARFSFPPHRDFKLSQSILDPPGQHPRSGAVKFGKDGKPFYVAGPRDNATAIMRRLMQNPGPDNFDFRIGPGQLPGETASGAAGDLEPQGERPSLLWTPGRRQSEGGEEQPLLWTPRP